jgi:cobalamin-dependent methionine synthase I
MPMYWIERTDHSVPRGDGSCGPADAGKDLDIPLLIGGATTSEMHTAVKINPAYDNPVIHVRDASKCTGVLSSLAFAFAKTGYVKGINERYTVLRVKQGMTRRETIY